MTIEVKITPDQLHAVTSDAAILRYMCVRLVQCGVPARINGISLSVERGKLTATADHDGVTYRWEEECAEVAT